MKTINKRYILIGLLGVLLLLYGLFVSYFIPNWSGVIVNNISDSILKQDSGKLIVTAFQFVTKYLMVFFCIYLGAAMCAHAFIKRLNINIFYYLFIIISFGSIYFYNQLYQEHFSYVGVMTTITLIVFLTLYIPEQKNFYFIFSIILLFVVIASEWLQLLPVLSRFGFGTNDLAVSIKIADEYFTHNTLLNTLSTIFLFVFLFIAILLTYIVHLFNKQLYTSKRFHHQEKVLRKTRIAFIESAVYQEINTLVHDLKTPIVTVQGLLSLLQMKSNIPNSEYLVRIDQSLDRMNDMISEILYENIKQYISIKELLEYVTGHLGLDDQQIEIMTDIQENLPPIYVNKIRFSRAIANILGNAITSFKGREGIIHIQAEQKDAQIYIHIHDNGPGIKESNLKNIWQNGFSTKESLGIGLSFVKKVIENHKGTITVNSIHGSYTQMNISLPIQMKGDEKNEYNHSNSG